MINSLDGFTILRFTKSFKSGAGMEKYLEDLDSILLKRNKIIIIRMYLETGSKAGKPTNREIGQGTLVEFPMPVSAEVIQSKSDNHNIKQSRTSLLKGLFRELIVYNPFLYRVFFKNYIRKNYTKQGDFPVINAGEKVRKIHQEFKVDLLVMHHVGRIDSAEIIEEAKKLRIPYIYINHYSNDYFINVSIREQMGDAAGIAGVSDFEVPRRLKDRFCNLSDGIDLVLFDPSMARPLNIEKNIPTIIYPARIMRVKGQTDLIKAYAKLKSEGLQARIVFAGRIDSPEYEEELKELARKNGLTDDVLFVGQLNTEELRDWYGVSSVLAFPTYHQEGLGRILVEAQAMKVPPVAYIIGGTPEGIQHRKTGFLVRKGDIQTFTKRLRELLIDEEKRKKMGEEGRRFVEKNFSLKALADRHEKFYLQVLNDARNRESQ